MNVRSDLCELQHTINSITQMQCVAYRSSPVSRLQQRQLRGPERLHRANVIARHAVQEDAIASHSQPSIIIWYCDVQWMWQGGFCQPGRKGRKSSNAALATLVA